MNRLIVPIVVVVLVVAGAWYTLRPQRETLGEVAAQPAPVTPIGEISADQVGQSVTIEGTITKQCPSTGCWAVVRDDTGEIRIETADGGFALPLHKEGRPITVTGKVVLKEGRNLEISATSAQVR